MFGNFYAGLWATNIDFGTSDDSLFELYVGYYDEPESGFFYDISYSRFYLNDAGCDSAAIIAKAGGPLSDRISLEAGLEYNTDFETLGKELTVNYEATDKLGLAATVGQSETFDHNYWSVGGSYAFNDNVSFDLTYHGVTDSTFSDAGADGAFSISF